MKSSFIALGTNIEPRQEYLTLALESLANNKNIFIRSKSSIYETDPVGYLDQADFLNMVVKIETTLTPLELLDVCQAIEQQLGRERSVRFGPRKIDLDILEFNQESIETERLVIPHPRMCERAFVLIPLGEIAPNLVIPEQDVGVITLVNNLPVESKSGVRKWLSGK